MMLLFAWVECGRIGPMERTVAWQRARPHVVARVTLYWSCFRGKKTVRQIKLRGCHSRSAFVSVPGGNILAVRDTARVQLYSGHNGCLLRVGHFGAKVWLLSVAPGSTEDELRMCAVYGGPMSCYVHLATWKSAESLTVTGYVGPMLNGMQHMVISATGTMYFCDTYNCRVMAVTVPHTGMFDMRQLYVIRRPCLGLLACHDTVLVIVLEPQSLFGFDMCGFDLISGQARWNTFVSAATTHNMVNPCVVTDQSQEIVVLAASRRLLVYSGADGRLRRTIPLDHSVETIFAAPHNQIGLVSRIKGKKMGSVVTFCE